MEGLNAKDIEILRFYAEAGNRELYFNYLAHKAGNDGYPLLALGVVRNDNAPGATANVFADNQAVADGVAMGERGWQDFGVDLMRADFALRFKHFEAGRPDLALNLPVRDVQDSHDPIFRQYEINPDGWTPRQLLEAARRHGGDEEAEKVWAMLRDNSLKGLNRAGEATYAVLHTYNDDQLGADAYLRAMGKARTVALGLTRIILSGAGSVTGSMETRGSGCNCTTRSGNCTFFPRRSLIRKRWTHSMTCASCGCIASNCVSSSTRMMRTSIGRSWPARGWLPMPSLCNRRRAAMKPNRRPQDWHLGACISRCTSSAQPGSRGSMPWQENPGIRTASAWPAA